MNPVLKYRGGKSREIPRFLQYIPDDFNRYIEPFFWWRCSIFLS